MLCKHDNMVTSELNGILFGTELNTKTQFHFLRPVPNAVLLPCRTQINLTWQLHNKRTAVFSKVKFSLLKTVLNARK